jgi:dienelactone hydrolase
MDEPALFSIVLLLVVTACRQDSPPVGPGPTPTPVPGVCDAGEFLDEVFPEPIVEHDVVYSRVTDQFGTHDLGMDIYQPRGDTRRNRPAIVWVHGGKFQQGHKGNLREFAMEFARRGYVCAAIEYRLWRAYDPGAPAAQCVEIAQSDAQAAIRFLRAHAVDLTLDPARVAIAGYSAGSLTSFAVGYQYEFTGDNLSNPGQPHTVIAVMGMDGFLVKPADLLSSDPPFVLFRSGITSDIPDDREDPDAVPKLFAAAETLGIPHELHVVPGADHVNLVKPPFSQVIIAQAAPFLRGYVACR